MRGTTDTYLLTYLLTYFIGYKTLTVVHTKDKKEEKTCADYIVSAQKFNHKIDLFFTERWHNAL